MEAPRLSDAGFAERPRVVDVSQRHQGRELVTKAERKPKKNVTETSSFVIACRLQPRGGEEGLGEVGHKGRSALVRHLQQLRLAPPGSSVSEILIGKEKKIKTLLLSLE